MEFGERLKQLRREKNITQAVLADDLELSRSLVGMYERGERGPSFEAADKLADYFNVSLNYLMGYTDLREPYPRHDDPSGSRALMLSAYEQMLLGKIRSTSPEIQRAIRALLGIDV